MKPVIDVRSEIQDGRLRWHTTVKYGDKYYADSCGYCSCADSDDFMKSNHFRESIEVCLEELEIDHKFSAPALIAEARGEA